MDSASKKEKHPESAVGIDSDVQHVGQTLAPLNADSTLLAEDSEKPIAPELVLPLLGAMILFLATLEYMIPKPLPFLKLGLANLPILLSLTFLRPRDLITLMIIKVLGQGLIQGSLFSHLILFSLGSTIMSGLSMLGVYTLKIPKVTLVGISIIGAFCANLTQLLLAHIFLFGKDIWLIAPLFLGMGVATSILLGLVAIQFQSKSHWFQRVTQHG